MTRVQFEFPALFATASGMSANAQSEYLRLIRLEYLLLIVSSVLALNLAVTRTYYVAAAVAILASLSVLILRNARKPEQSWYRGRALAESIKTSCWKYCMGAEPFGRNDSPAVTRAEFRNYLTAILEANRFVGYEMPPDAAADEQITPSMEQIRSSDLGVRKTYYEELRIKNQRVWYAKKAAVNRNASRWWFRAAVGAYGAAIIMALARIAEPAAVIWPIEPFLVVASSLIGWMQVKKFNELASSYTLTAHEIGILQGKIAEVDSEESWSAFVVDAEQAFSREHTQWVARQQYA